MTEFSIPLDEIIANADVNGSTPDASALPPTLPRIDPVRGVFIASNGNEIELSDHPISALIVQRLQQEGKPKIPMIEITLLGKHKQIEPHAGHEGYRARLTEWEEEAQMRLVRYLFVIGTKGTPPQEFIDEQAQFFPNAPDSERKDLWVASRLPDADIGDFTEAVMGRTLPTAKGLDESADSFRS